MRLERDSPTLERLDLQEVIHYVDGNQKDFEHLFGFEIWLYPHPLLVEDELQVE